MAKSTWGFDKAERHFDNMPSLMKRNLNRATKSAAISMRDSIIRTIRDGRPMWPPLLAATIARKGSSSPLIEHADLLRSITCIPDGPSRFFIGVPRNVRNSAGESLVNIGLVHEFGTRHIPARSFIATTFEDKRKDISDRWGKAVKAILNGETYVR